MDILEFTEIIWDGKARYERKYKVKTAQLKKAVSQIHQACQGKRANELPYFFIVGAGVSYPPVKLAKDIIEDCKEAAKGFERDSALDSKIDKVDEYSYWFEQGYPQKKMRQEYLQEIIENKPVSNANLRLAHILASGKVANLVITPNFDDFVSRSLNIFGCNHLICDHPKMIAKMDLEKTDIKIVHVHGTYWFYDCCNLREEIESRAEEDGLWSMSFFLERALMRRSPIVVGYSGWENDVIMTALKKRLKTQLPYNLYWFCHTRNEMEALPVWLKGHGDVVFVLPAENEVCARLEDKEGGKFVEEVKKLNAREVFEAIIKEFAIELPEIFTDPIGLLMNSLKKILPDPVESKEKCEEIYFIDDVIERLKKAKEYDEKKKAKKSDAEKLLGEIKLLVSKSLDEELIEKLNIKKVSRIDTESKDKLCEIVWPILLKKGVSEGLLLKGYDFINVISNQILSDNRNSVCIKERAVRAMLYKALILGAEDSKQEVIIYNEIIEKYADDKEAVIRQIVARAMRYKAFILGTEDSKQEVIIYNEIIEKYADDKEAGIRQIVAEAMLDKSYNLVEEDRKQRVTICDEIIEKYASDKETGIRQIVARAMLNKSHSLDGEDNKQEVTIYDEIIEKYAGDKEAAIRVQVAKAMFNKSLSREDRKQRITIYNEIIEKYAGDKETGIRQIVARAMLNKAYSLDGEDSKQSVIICDEIIEKYAGDKESVIRVQVVRAMLYKALILGEEDSKQEVAIYDEIIEKYSGDKEMSIREQVITAMFNKGMVLIKSKETVEEGRRILNHLLKNGEPEAGNTLGMDYYFKGDFYSATECFYESYLLNDWRGGNNLAYMIRRGEAKSDAPLPGVYELLSLGLKNNESLVLTNYSLCLASGFQCTEDWMLADQTMASIPNPKESLDWWYGLGENDAAEKNLVVAWLVRHKLIDNPDDKSVRERLEVAKSGGWNVPDWMMEVQ